MNVCPVLPAGQRLARQGVLAGDEGLGRFRLQRYALPRDPLMRRRRHRRRLAYGIVSRPGVTPAHTSLSGYEDVVSGLGRFSLGKSLKKLTRSKLFKYAAIGTAAYFTGGLALKAAPALMRSGMFRGAGKALKGSLGPAVQAYTSTQAVQPVPGSAAAPFGGTDFDSYGYGGGGSSYGGGGGYGTSAGGAGYEDQGAAPEEAGAAATGGAPRWLIPAAIGGVLLLGLSSRRGRRR